MPVALRRSALLLSVFLVLAFVVFLVNQTAQVVQLAATIHPTFGQVVLWGLLALYGALLLTPVALLTHLPRRVAPPASENGPEFAAHLETIRIRLRRNQRFAGATLDERADVEAAIRTLDAAADQIVCETASTVFLSTAVSQNGRLDGLVVLAAQSRMVWRIARTYYQRPSVADLWHLYSNVATTAFVAHSLDDIDLSEQVEPVLSAVIGSSVGALPGLQVASTVFVNSVTSGSANAFLTLRVGMIAKRYCNTLVAADRRLLRKSATAEATAVLGQVVSEGALQLGSAFGTAVRKKIGGVVTAASQSAGQAGTAARSAITTVVGTVSGSISSAGASLAETTTRLTSRVRPSKPGETLAAASIHPQSGDAEVP